MPLGLPELIPTTWLAVLATFTVILLVTARSGLSRSLGLLFLGVLLTSVSLGSALERRVEVFPVDGHWQGEGTIIGLPRTRNDSTEFRFEPEQPARRRTPHTWLVRWHRKDGEATPDLRPGQRWTLDLKLKPVRGRLNFSGDDSERWALSEGLTALATVRAAMQVPAQNPRQLGESWRWSVRQALAGRLVNQPGSELLMALAIADRSGLDAEDRETVRTTGTGHLLAISGLHVGLVGWLAYWLFRASWFCVPLRPSRIDVHRCALLFSLAPAIAYATLAGWGTSTQRAVIMLTAWVTVMAWGRASGALRSFWLALAAVLIVDPLSPLQAGFWLSFGAVAALLWMFAPRRPSPPAWRALCRAQWAITLLVTPLALYWFGFVTPAGFLVNLAAIPYISFVTLPLVLLSLMSLPGPDLISDALLTMAATSAHWAMLGLHVAASRLADWSFHLPPAGVGLTLLAVFGGALASLPAGIRARWLGLPLMIPISFQTDSRPAPGTHQVEILDVGQGLAVLVRTHRHLLLYDTGPGLPANWDLVDRVLAPAFARHGRERPDWLLVSHGDLDHAGGLDRLARDMAARQMVNRRLATGPGCFTPMRWQWDGVTFSVLHPTRFLPYLGNDSSCVLSIRGPGGASLLPGDVSYRAERRLLGTPGGFDLVIAPHHGSRSSSHAGFVAWSQADWVVAATGQGNRFGFPHQEVVERWQAQGSRLVSTAGCGALRFDLAGGTVTQVRSARHERPAPWRFPAAGRCP